MVIGLVIRLCGIVFFKHMGHLAELQMQQNWPELLEINGIMSEKA